MYSALFRTNLVCERSFFNIFQKKITNRYFFGDSTNDHNIKRFRLIKRLASTVLFGGTFLTVIYARRKKRSSLISEAKLVQNSNFCNKNFKLFEYNGFILPSFVMNNLTNIQNFSCREDDIFVVTFPKSGTTWLQEIIYCILNGIDSSSAKSIEDRFPYLEFVYPGLESIKKMTGQRFIKTHLPYSLLPHDVQVKKPKIFCIMRNPKDVCVSYYHFVRMMTISDYKGTFPEFFDDFISNKVPYSPFWRHCKDIWEHRNDDNVLILNYEDFHKDIHSNIKKIANFLERNISETEVDAIADHCSFQNMSQNPNVNYQHWDYLGIRNKNEAKFMRKGIVGDWQNYFTPEMKQKMDLWIDENLKDIVILLPSEFQNYK